MRREEFSRRDKIRKTGGLNDTALCSVHITVKSETWEGSEGILLMILIF